ncbi:MAG: S-layer homology domain-containing protein, partial [Clostridia bacterium]|nr:S-layer homology domain-containing protein [Clostridia bacterium]
IVMTVNGEVLFDETKALSGLVSKEGYIGFVNSPGTTVTVSPINVDKTELKQAIDSANALLQDAEAGTEYGQYPAEQLEALKKEVENSQKIFDSEYTSTDGAQKAAASLEDLYQELKDAVGTVKIFTQDEAVDMIDWVPELKFIINAGVRKPVLKMTPGENLVPQIRSEADGVTMELAAGTVLTGRNWNGELQLPVKGDSPSGTSASSAKPKEVYSLGSSVPVQADQWVKIVLTGQKSARIAYLNEQGTYTTVKTVPSSGDLSNVTIYRTTEGNDAVIYTKLLTELVSYEITEPSPSPVPTVEPVIPGNGGGSSGGIYTGAINQGTEQPTEASSFTDIIGHWAEKDINDLYQKGIVAGVTATTFEPDREITRAEFATLIVKALKLTGNPQGFFEDVEQGAWYTSYVNLAAEAGLIQGYDGKFRPEDTITRQEAAVIAVKAYEFLGKEATSKELSFTDASDIQPWAKDYVEKSVGAGIISGMTDGSFAPLACTTRAQAVAILKRIL